jgi:hypothetical protein
MANHSRNGAGTKEKNRPISKLGRELRAISDKIAASGERPLNRREIAREVAERRGAR